MIGFVVGLGVIGGVFVWGRLRVRRLIDRLEQQIRDLRTQLDREVLYRAIGPEDGDLAARIGELAVPTAELVAQGFEVLGDLVEHTPELPMKGLGRWVVDGSGTVFGRIGIVAANRPSVGPIVMLLSHAATDRYVTLRTSRPARLPSTPFVHRLDLSGDVAMRDVVARHRAHASAEKGELVKVATLDEVTADVRRARAASAAWRNAQPPEVLLDQDLRAILGPAYQRLGPGLVRRLASRLPTATVVAR